MPNVVCPYCQQQVGYSEQLSGQVVGCPHCNTAFQMPRRARSPHLEQAATGRRGRLRAKSPPQSPGLAAVLSFLIPGLGQILNGQIGKGIAILVSMIILAALSFLILPCIFGAVLWLWNIYDAFLSAEQYNRRLY